ncbi:MAG TPA: DUF4232 domain-containing protein [Gaiellaceae bacterium]|nr:DUF4232 domain-containing protein [Gaiellaceae bacterium]
MKALIALVLIATALLPEAGAARTATPACGGRDLGGSFRVVPGSPGAGGITYRLRLTNRSSGACWVSGIPQLRLLGAKGGALPTHVSAAYPGQPTAARIVLAPGRTAKSDARFSPDVPGPGEGHPGQCEPSAHRLRVTVGGSSLTVAVTPPTPVCEHGSLRMSLFSAA